MLGIAEQLLGIAEKCPEESKSAQHRRKTTWQSSNVQVLYLWATIYQGPKICHGYVKSTKAYEDIVKSGGLLCLDLEGWLGNSQVIVNNCKLLSTFISPQTLFYLIVQCHFNCPYTSHAIFNTDDHHTTLFSKNVDAATWVDPHFSFSGINRLSLLGYCIFKSM